MCKFTLPLIKEAVFHTVHSQREAVDCCGQNAFKCRVLCSVLPTEPVKEMEKAGGEVDLLLLHPVNSEQPNAVLGTG